MGISLWGKREKTDRKKGKRLSRQTTLSDLWEEGLLVQREPAEKKEGFPSSKGRTFSGGELRGELYRYQDPH